MRPVVTSGGGITGSDVTSGHCSRGSEGVGVWGVCVLGWGVGSLAARSASALSYSFQASASGPGYHLGSSWHAEPAPSWPAAARSTNRGHSHLPVTGRFHFLHRRMHMHTCKWCKGALRDSLQLSRTKMKDVSNVWLVFAFSVHTRCSFWSTSLLLAAWRSSSLGQITWRLWLPPRVFATKLADQFCFSIWPFHWWNGILSEGNVIKTNRTLRKYGNCLICDKQLMKYQLFIQFRCVFEGGMYLCVFRGHRCAVTKFSVLFTLFTLSDTVVECWMCFRLDDRCGQSAQVQGAGCRVHADGSWSPAIPGHPGKTFKLPVK